MSADPNSLAPPAPLPTVMPTSSMAGLGGALLPQNQNALANAMRARKKALTPFASTLAKAPTPAPGPAPAPATPAAQTPLEAAQAAYANFKPYQMQDVAYTPPEAPKPDSPVRAILDALGAVAMRHGAGGQVSGVVAQRQADAQKKYQDDLKTAKDKYDAREQAEEARAQSSDRTQAGLQKNLYDQEQVADRQAQLAETAKKDAETARLKGQAQTIAKQRADTYARSVANTYLSNKAKLAESSRQHLAENHLKEDGFTLSAEEAQWRNFAGLQRAGIQRETALQVAQQRNTLALTLQRLRGAQQTAAIGERGQIQGQIAQVNDMLREYDATIARGSSALASPQAQAAVAALTTPGKDGTSPYDQLMGKIRSLSGIAVTPDENFAGMGQEAAQQEASYLGEYNSSIDSTGAFDPGLTSGSGGGGTTVVNNYIGGAGGGQVPSLGGALGAGPYGGLSGGMGLGGGGMSVPPEIADTTGRAAAQFGVDPQMMLRMLNTESGFQEDGPDGKIITSPTGAQGIAQFTPQTAKAYGVNVNDSTSSIYGMAHYMSNLMRHYNGNTVLAVAAYNAGPGTVDATRGDLTKLPPETQSYLQSVFGPGVGRMSGGGQPAPVRPNTKTGTTGPNGATRTAATSGKPPAPNQNQNNVPPQQAAQAIYKSMYEGQPNLAGQSFDQAWPQIKEHLLSKGVSAQDVAQIEPLIKPQIDKAHAAYVKNQEDQAGKDALENQIGLIMSSAPGMSREQATVIAQRRVKQPQPNPGQMAQGAASALGFGKQQAPAAPTNPVVFAKQLLAQMAGQAGSAQSVVATIKARYGVSDQVAASILAAAQSPNAPQPQAAQTSGPPMQAPIAQLGLR